MAEVLQKTGQEFWQPPSPMLASDLAIPETPPVMAEVCPSCGSEFLLGSRFCHSCGRKRPEALSPEDKAHAAEMAGLWQDGVTWLQGKVQQVSFRGTWSRIKFPAWLRYLTFHEIQQWVGLSTASLVAFIIGMVCVAGALLVGLLAAKTFGEWQAIQLYRAECLLAATTAFVAGILLKRSSKSDE